MYSEIWNDSSWGRWAHWLSQLQETYNFPLLAVELWRTGASTTHFSFGHSFATCFSPRPCLFLKFGHMCPNFSTTQGLWAKRMANKLCLTTFRLCLHETLCQSFLLFTSILPSIAAESVNINVQKHCHGRRIKFVHGHVLLLSIECPMLRWR